MRIGKYKKLRENELATWLVIWRLPFFALLLSVVILGSHLFSNQAITKAWSEIGRSEIGISGLDNKSGAMGASASSKLPGTEHMLALIQPSAKNDGNQRQSTERTATERGEDREKVAREFVLVADEVNRIFQLRISPEGRLSINSPSEPRNWVSNPKDRVRKLSWYNEYSILLVVYDDRIKFYRHSARGVATHLNHLIENHNNNAGSPAVIKNNVETEGAIINAVLSRNGELVAFITKKGTFIARVDARARGNVKSEKIDILRDGTNIDLARGVGREEFTILASNANKEPLIFSLNATQQLEKSVGNEVASLVLPKFSGDILGITMNNQGFLALIPIVTANGGFVYAVGQDGSGVFSANGRFQKFVLSNSNFQLGSKLTTFSLSRSGRHFYVGTTRGDVCSVEFEKDLSKVDIFDENSFSCFSAGKFSIRGAYPLYSGNIVLTFSERRSVETYVKKNNTYKISHSYSLKDARERIIAFETF